MIFNELTYFIFFLAPCVLLFHKIKNELRPWVITIFGILFFIYFSQIHFGGNWGSLCVLIFVWELLTSRLYKPGSRWCIFGIVQAIVILIVFKYLSFFVTGLNDLANILNLPVLTGFKKIILPLGVSFFTFEFIHFAFDCYKGKIVNAKMGTYASFIFFFPTMVAGPIKRFQDFAPKIESPKINTQVITLAITRIFCGLFKKHVLADTFSLWSDRLNTEALYQASGHQIFLWILSYGFKIYFDFSAYSDIAIACANLFGIEVPENFNWPYFSKNISEFWRKWHISLGKWISDYIYIPLGGNQGKEVRTIINLVLAFTLSGLWHGAAYNFIVWGIWHGISVAIYRQWQRFGFKLPGALAMLLTYLTANLGWAFFCMDLPRAIYAFSKMAGVK